MENVIVLNNDYSFLNVVSIQRAFSYIAKGKVIVEKYTNEIIATAEKTFKIPKIIRFTYLIYQIYKRKIPWTKKNVWLRDNYTCGYCGKKSENMTVDHVIPKTKGGQNTFENTVTACKECNSKKGDKLPQECGMFPKHRLVRPSLLDFLKKRYNLSEIDNLIKTIWE